MWLKNFLLIMALFMVLLCGVSAISAASDNAVDNLTSELDSGFDSISVCNDEKAIGVDDENSALNAQENDDEINGQAHDGNSKLSAADDTILSEGEGQNEPKNYSGLTVDELTVDDDEAAVFNCSIGTLTVNGNNVAIFNNTVSSKIILNGINAIIHNNILGTITTGSVTDAGTGAEVYNNTATGVSLTCDKSNVYFNQISGDLLVGNNATIFNNTAVKMTIGDYSKVHDNVVSNRLIVGVNSEVYNNNVSTLSVGANSQVYYHVLSSFGMGVGCIIHDNIINSNMAIYSDSILYNNIMGATLIRTIAASNVKIYNNTIPAQFTVMNSKNITIVGNKFGGAVNFQNSNNNSLINNTINSSTEYAVSFTSSSGTIVQGNILYGKGRYGIDAINNPDSNYIYDNTPYVPILSILVNNIVVGDRLVITVQTNGNAVDHVKMFINDEFRVVSISKGSGKVTLRNLPAGDYSIVVISDSFGDYGQGKNSTIAKVSKLNPILNLNVDDAVIGGDVNIFATITGATGNVTFVVDGVENNAELIGGMATFTINNVVEGNHSIVAMYNGDDKNEAVSNHSTFSLQKATPTVNLTYDNPVIGKSLIFNVNVINATGVVKFIIDGVENNVTLSNGSATYTIEKVSAGTHNIVANYVGDILNNPASCYKSFTLEKTNPIVEVNVEDLKLGEDTKVVVTIANATGKVNIIIDGVENIVDLENGAAVHIMKDVPAGIHTIVANYEGDEKFNPTFVSTTKELKVLSTIFTEISVDGNLNIKAFLRDSDGNGVANAIISYVRDNVTNTTVSDVNGSFTIKGKEGAKVSISYAGNDSLSPTSNVVVLDNIAPSRTVSVLTAAKLTCYAIDSGVGEKGAVFKVTLKDKADKGISNEKITVVLDNKVYPLKTNSKGVASMQVNIANAGTYTATVSFLGNTYNDASFTTAKIVINKKTTSIIAKATKFKSKVKTKKYTVTLKTIKGSSVDGKAYLKAGKKVTIKINKKTYTAKTNKNGKVTFKITKLNKKGKYNAVIKFAGDNTYKATSKKVKIIVK